LTREATEPHGSNQRNALCDMFRRLTDVYGARGQLSVALRWRALTYEAVREENEPVHDFMSKRVLCGTREILKLAEPDRGQEEPGEFLRDEHIACLVKPIKHLAEMIRTGFMTAIYEVCVERPGEVYDISRMEAWEPDRAQLKTKQVVICNGIRFA